MLSNLDYLYGLKREGIKFDLDVMRGFADMIGHPENRFKSFHITGSNGKGSTSEFIYSILRQKFSAGIYTSPHLIKFNERIMVNDSMIPDDYIDSFIGKYRPMIEDLAKINRNPTFFEVTTMMAFQYFADMKVDYASVEVGLGGRLDATNIIMPLVSVITQVGYEHADKLGCSLTSIAYEKGGIIKEGRPIVLQDQKPEVVKTIKSISQVRGSPLIMLDPQKIRGLNLSEAGTSFDFEGMNGTYHLETDLIGEYQALNAATAVLAIEASGIGLEKNDIERGIKSARWPGRLEIISRDPLIIIDAAHNPPAVNKMANTFRKVFTKKPLIVAGILSDKDSYAYFHVIRQISDRIIFTTPEEKERAVDPKKLYDLYGHLFSEARVIPDPIDAVNEAAKRSDFVLVTGSIYLIGAVKEYYEKKREKVVA
ncbi:tetrahydrofolylpolyglutamate synthase related protein [Thermoplasma acidophilum]|uniref:Tetrahydrofolylpolyglutamate synthase related protein n=1 Tax=Thermoplasma acidophilum (strain ATCC 25905 / DSM 1728 / JCM 9062 / NBRC 15155 / AMRC-C165) TaxID=273075 RepID=Q9HKG2_THEAC|nr:folylpolyglutamate synthase/dihydrofolate synthase family protein [Thermoplasma acidophilum]CAC11776.1 tetrahydrofolylpolyglutamate synthase related protein [Thermoplasma acidophilum]